MATNCCRPHCCLYSVWRPLDPTKMLASATAALRTSPCLFPYASARVDYMVKYKIKYTAADKQLPATFVYWRPAHVQIARAPFARIPREDECTVVRLGAVTFIKLFGRLFLVKNCQYKRRTTMISSSNVSFARISFLTVLLERLIHRDVFCL